MSSTKELAEFSKLSIGSKLPYWLEIKNYFTDNKYPIQIERPNMKNGGLEDGPNEIPYWLQIEQFMMGENRID